MYNIENLRAVSLLRVSTGRQTSKDEKDIPDQRRLVEDFLKREKLILVKEFVEGGISAYKNKSNRDAILDIKQMAKEKKFDVFVAYKSDRIGRDSDESPLVIAGLNEAGVRVFTVNDGEIKTSTQMDKLYTFLQFWQNESESVKKAEVATDFQILAIKQGKWRGGGKSFVPYGYKAIDNGSKNQKGKAILDFVIDENEAEIIKKIYDWSINYNMGAKSIAEKLNIENIQTRNGKQWYYSTINSIFNNIIYKGYFHINSKLRKETVISPQQPHLVIIPDDEWEENQKCMKKRSTYRDSRTKGISQSKSLLSGIIYCGYCGKKLTPWQNYKTYKSKSGKRRYVQRYYRCTSSLSYSGNKCEGQTSYSANRIEPMVEKRFKEFVLSVSHKRFKEDYKKEFQDQIVSIQNRKKEINKQLDEQQENYFRYKGEINKTLKGIGTFNAKILSEMIDDCLEQKEKLLLEIDKINEDILQAERVLKEYQYIEINLSDMIAKYDNSDLDTKKSILSKIIKKVTIYREDCKIEYTITINDFLTNSEDIENFNKGWQDIGCELDHSGSAQQDLLQPNFIINIIKNYSF